MTKADGGDTFGRPTAQEVAEAHWSRYSILGQGVMHLAAGALDEGDQAVDLSFNARRYAREAGLSGLDEELASGWFDGARNRAQFDRLAQVARWNQDLKQTIIDGHDGSAVLNFAYGLLDVTSLLSVAGLGRGALGGAAVGLTDALAQNAVLHKLQPLREREDDFMNIGVSTFLGAGLGAVFNRLPHDSPLRPGHPDNPLHPENLDKTPLREQGLGSSSGAELRGDSIGAARVAQGYDDAGNPVYRPRMAGDDFKIAQGGKAQQWIDDTLFGGLTPIGRMTHYDGPGLEAMARLTDIPGLNLRGHLEGRVQGPDAESLRTLYTLEGQKAAEDVVGLFRKANEDLGDSASGLLHDAKDMVHSLSTGTVDVGSVSRRDFMAAVDDLNIAAATARQTQGDIYAPIIAKLKDSLGGDEAKATKVFGRVKEAVERQQKFYNDFWDEAVRHGAADPRLAQDGHYTPVLYNKKGIDKNPAEFETMLLEHVADKPQTEFLQAQGYIAQGGPPKPVKPGEKAEALPADWEALKAQDPARAAKAIREWAGDQELARTLVAEGRVAAAETRQAAAQEAAADVLDDFRGASKDYRKASLKELRAEAAEQTLAANVRNLGAAQRAAEKAEAKVNAALAKVKDPYALAEDLQEQLARGGHDLDAHARAVRQAERSADDAQGFVGFLRDEKTPHLDARKDLAPLKDEDWRAARDLEHAQTQIAEVNRELREALENRKTAQDHLREARAVFEDTASRQRNAADWKAAVDKEVRTLLQHEDHADLAPGFRERMARDTERLDKLRIALEDAQAARQKALIMKRLLRQDLTAAAKEVRDSAHALRKAQWAASRNAKQTPAAKWAQQLTNHLRGGQRAPGGLLLDKAPMTGRLKQKTLNWSFEEMQKLKAMEFRESDPLHQMDRYTSDLGGQVAAHRAFDGASRDEVLREAMGHYDTLIAGAKSEKEKAAIRTVRDKNLKDVEAIWDKVLGRHEVKDDDALTWTIDRLKQATLLRYQGGFIFGAVNDIATGMYAARGFAPGLVAMRGKTGKLIAEAAKGHEGAKELSTFLQSLEHGSHMAFSERALASGAGEDLAGFGSGLTRQVTGKVEAVMNATADATGKLSGLKGFSDIMRRTAAWVQLTNIRRWAKDGWDKLPAGKRADLAKLGIGKTELTQIGRLMDKHGEDVKDLFIPNTHKWIADSQGNTDPLGAHMADVLNLALVKTAKRASIVSGFGNQPLLMSKPMGRLFLQFQSYAATFYQGFLRSAVQHGALTGEYGRSAMALGWALAAGEMSAQIAAFRKEGTAGLGNYNDPDKKAAHAVEVIQRSGFLGMAGAPLQAGVNLLSPVLNARTGVTLTGSTSKYSQNGWLANLAGPWSQTLADVSQMGADAANGEGSRVWKKAHTLIPLNQQAKVLMHLAGVDSF
ncbi:hypothetical protein [Xylophilus sp.]|uniref:hypothetical protein n=1 Tax=Xylophilus sp. TaxID=2653893 RepID=UPI002D7F0DA7|nr:hypothetical protein [Xylophilus sp.]